MGFDMMGHAFWVTLGVTLSLVALWARVSEEYPLSLVGWLRCLPLVWRNEVWSRIPLFQEASLSWMIIFIYVGALFGIAYSFAQRREWSEAGSLLLIALLAGFLGRRGDSPEVLREVLRASEVVSGEVTPHAYK